LPEAIPGMCACQLLAETKVIDIKINIWNLNEPKSLVLRLFSVEDFPNHILTTID